MRGWLVEDQEAKRDAVRHAVSTAAIAVIPFAGVVAAAVCWLRYATTGHLPW